MTLHILSNPRKPIGKTDRIDALGVAVSKFIDHIQKFGWQCIHYGVEGCEANCETVICGELSANSITPYNIKAGEEIKQRKQPGDLLLCFYGRDNSQAAEMNSDLTIIEPNIGYDHAAVFAPYRVFTSYALMHMYYGHKSMLMNPSWFDAVIPNSFDPDEFEFNTNKADYLLYFGRVIESKGIHLAIQAAEYTKKQLVIAGPGSIKQLGYDKIPNNVVCLGPCDPKHRKILMKNARAIIGPTYYVEPFGNMVVEGYFSGTPAITTDWGGFTETVVNGVTGFRCRDFADVIYAIENVNTIDPYVCRKWAEDNYSDDVIYEKYHKYLQKIVARNFYKV